MMNLTVLCPHFAPDEAPTGDIMTRIVHELAGRGNRVHVVTSLPWYLHHAIEPEWRGRPVRRESTSWGSITRVHPFPTEKTNIPARALAFGGFTGLAAVMAAVHRPRPDAVLAMSPPLTLGLAGWGVARIRRAPFVFNIQDVFPDVAIETGVLRGRRVIRAALALERFVYRRADAVTVLSEDLRANVAAKLGPERADRVRVIPNFADVTDIVPAPRQNAYRAEFGLGDRQVIMYAGNLGFSQPVEVLLDAATTFADDPDIVFVINGSGSARSSLERAAEGLENVVMVPRQPRERLAEVLAAADLHIVMLSRGLGHASVPSKLYSILAAGRPVVARVDAGTEVARMVTEAKAGQAIPPEDPEALAQAIAVVVRDRERAVAQGRAGRRFVEKWPTAADVAQRYEALFTEIGPVA